MNWIISELFYPDEVSTAQILTDIALKKIENNEISVICGPPGYEKSYVHQNKNLDKRIKIFRVNLPKLNKNKLFQRTFRLLLLSFKMSWLVLKKVNKKDNILITTNPSLLILLIVVLKKLKKFKLEILVHDVFPENLVPTGLIKKNSYIYKLLDKIYNFAYKKCDRIIVLGEDMKVLFQQKTSPKILNIDIITNWSDGDVRPINNFNISEYLGLNVNNKIVIGFAGNLGRVQGILEFIELFKMSKNSNLVFIIIGDGALKSKIQENIKNLSNIYYLGVKGRSEQNYFLNACHIGLITLKSGMKGLGVPSKTYNLMAAGKPLLFIGDKKSEIDNYINFFECGWSFSWEKENEIISFLSELSKESLKNITQKGYNSIVASENFRKDKILNLF